MKLEPEIKFLVEEGKRKGFLTYEEVNRLLPEDVASGDKIDRIFEMLEEMGIELGDEDEQEPRPRSRKKKKKYWRPGTRWGAVAGRRTTRLQARRSYFTASVTLKLTEPISLTITVMPKVRRPGRSSVPCT